MIFSVGDKIPVRDLEESRQIIEVLKEHNVKYLYRFSENGKYIQIENQDYDAEKMQDNEAVVFGIMFRYGFWNIRKCLRVFKSQSGYIGYARCQEVCIGMFRSEPEMIVAHNVAISKGLNVGMIGKLLIDKKHLPPED